MTQTAPMPVDISTTALLTTLTISMWSADRNDSRINAEVAARYGSDSKMSKYKRYLLNPDALKPTKQVAGAWRTRHYELTLPWGDDGARIISGKGFTRHRDESESFSSQYWAAVEVFLAEYPDRVNEARQLLNGLWDAAEYPDTEVLRGKFGAAVKYRPVPSADDFRVAISQDQADIIRQQIVDDSQAAVDGAMQDVTRRVRDAVGHLAERMLNYSGGRDGAFRDSLIDNVRELADLLPELNLTDDSRIAAIGQRMQAELVGYSADTLRENASARGQVARAAEDILARMQGYGL